MREMKDSGIEWIGEIPKDWELTRIGSIYGLRTQKVSDTDFPPLSVTKKGILPQLESAAKTNDGDNRKLVKKGDFVINGRSDRRGSCGVSPYVGSVSLINIVLKPYKDMNPIYFDWLFHTVSFADEFYRWGRGIVADLWSTKWQEMKKINVPYPPQNQQQKIANFLDEKCSEIDSLISDIKSQIEILEQYKKSVITEAVTKGLDRNAKMKDSGVEWIGEIPSDWDMHPLLYYFDERKVLNRFGVEQNLLSLSYGKIIEKDINSSGGLLPESFNTYNIIEDGDIVLRLTDLQNDKKSLRTGLSRQHGIITSAYVAIKPIKNINSEYYYSLLHAYDVQKVFYNMGNGVRQGLTYSTLSKLILINPSIEVQNEIVQYLKVKCSEIEQTITDKQSQIATLEEYKKSMIFEYVTGKKEVV